MRNVLIIISLFASTIMYSQETNPVSWEFNTKIVEEQQQIVLSAHIENGWYVYSQQVPEDGPVPTTIIWTENEAINPIGSISEQGEIVKQGIDPMFDVVLTKYGKTASFTQQIEVAEAGTLEGSVTYMSCNHAMCLPPETIDFEIFISK